MNRSTLAAATVAALLALSACSSDDDDAPEADASAQGGENQLPGELPEQPGGDSSFNPDLEPAPPSTEPSGNDTSAIAGLWDASGGPEGRRDERYVDISDDGLYTIYDFQQDDVTAGEMCYTVTPRRLDLETGDAASGTYSVSGQQGFVVTDEGEPDTLTVAFIDEDSGEAGTSEAWPRVVGDTVENLTICSDE